jgi:hypothetical protein
MNLNPSALVGVLLVVGAAPLTTRAQTPQLFFQPDTSLEPATIAELRRGAQIQKLAQCALPVLAAQSDWVRSRGPDDYFEIGLPPNWKLEKLDSIPLPRATFGAANGDRISIARMAFATSGRPGMFNPAGVIQPERNCEVSNDKSGSILWYFSDDGRFAVLGYAVTPEGKHYGIGLSTFTSANLDTLVALATRAVLTSRRH